MRGFKYRTVSENLECGLRWGMVYIELEPSLLASQLHIYDIARVGLAQEGPPIQLVPLYGAGLPFP